MAGWTETLVEVEKIERNCQNEKLFARVSLKIFVSGRLVPLMRLENVQQIQTNLPEKLSSISWGRRKSS